MRHLSAIAASLVIIAGAVCPPPAVAQVIFGRGGAGIVIMNDGSINGEAVKTEPDPTGPHLIEFFDGRRLHGTIEALDLAHQELTWRRGDTDTPLVIPTIEISHLSFDLSAQPQLNGALADLGGLQPVTNPSDTADNKAHATIKFAGGDWLVADVTNILDNKVHLQLADNTPLVVDRARVEWIYLSKGPAPECYEGPASLSGWISAGGWSYRDGALRALNPTQIGRNFGPLPDQVEYQFEVDQGNLMSQFNFTLHGRAGLGWVGAQKMIQCMLRANTLNVYTNSGGNFKSQQVNLPQPLVDILDGRAKPGKNNPVLVRVFEDFTGGKLLIFINGQKAGEWSLDKGEAGRNGGGFTFQPTIWNSNSEQTLSKIRVMPWDGRLPDEKGQTDDPTTDHILLADGTTHDGKFVDLASGTVRMRVDNTPFESPRDQVRMLRFSHQPAPADASPSVAHLRLAQGGEFDAASIGLHDGKFDVRTRFGMEFDVPVASLTELRFAQTAPALAVAEDVLVFKNGDRLKGHLESAAENQKVRWRVGESTKVVDFAMTHLLGVRRDGQEPSTPKHLDCAARFRNGDWLAGRFLTLDKNELVLDTADAGQLTIARAQVRTLYFSRDGTLPISDGTTDEREWLKGLDLRNALSTGRVPPANPSGVWRSFDGTFALNSPAEIQALASRGGGGLHIGRQLDSLPALVEVSFDVTGTRDQILFTAQLFSEAGNPGYLLQFHGQGLYIYDLNPVQRGRGGIVPQQTQFDGKLKPNASQRHIQLLANRDTGQVTMLVDGVLITRFGGKSNSPPRQLGHGLMLSPQIGMPCTFSNLWFGPWNGRIPGQVIGTDAAPDTAVLNNGDETQGAIEMATPSSVKIASDVGPLDLPVDRLTLLDFGGPPPARTPGARVHLVGSGSLTIGAYRVEIDTVACHSEIAGDLLLPLGAIQELVFASTEPAKQ